MPTFIHHFLGNWVYSEDDTSARCEGGYTQEYDSLNKVLDSHARATFEWMLEHGEQVTSSGANVFHIKK
jgi:hypothetical protein